MRGRYRKSGEETTEIKALRDELIEMGEHCIRLQDKLHSAEHQLCEIAQYLGRDASAPGVSSIFDVVKQDIESLKERVRNSI